MDVVVTTERMTAQEYLAIPYDEGVRTWLVEGEVVVNDPRLPHQLVARDLLFALHTWTLAAAGRGAVSLPLDVLIDERNVYGPDLLWYAEGHVPDDLSWPYAVPDLAVEVRSPSTWRYDIGAKKAGYERSGLPELWLVDTKSHTVLVFRRSAPRAPSFDVALELGRADDLSSPQLPGFTLALATLFGD